MRTIVRLAATAAVLMLTSFGMAGAASAVESPTPDPTYGCQGSNGYAPAGPCELKVQTEAICEKNTPYLQYALTPVGTPNTTATITFLNPSGKNVVFADQPLTGTLLWPGATVGSDSKGTDWPGWMQKPDGTWVADSSDAWLAGTVNVHFQVNPEATVQVTYPAATLACSPPRSQVLADEDDELAATGSDAGLMLGVAGGLVGLGLIVLGARAVARRRHATV